MKECNHCQHVEMCERREYVEGQGCEFFDNGNRWIPISERLPEDKTYVLTTIKIPNRIAHARSGWYEGGFFHNDNGDVWKATDMEVIAWMPLPEPYKAESEG